MNGDYFLKRPFDILLASIGLLISLPLWIVVAIAILIEDGRPIFYASGRVGKGGKIFKALKFRTMIRESDSVFGPLQAGVDDKRVTAVGKFIRPLALDELPQLWSIFKGDMSFVGPRALLPTEIELKNGGTDSVPIDEVPGYSKRQSVRPGLTGVAQIYAPRDIIRKNKFRYDLLYIKKAGFFLDLGLIFLSFWITFRGKWETRTKKF